MHEGIIIHNRADDRRVMHDDGRVGSGDKLRVGGGAGQPLRVVLGIAALNRIREQVPHGRQKARPAGGGISIVAIDGGVGDGDGDGRSERGRGHRGEGAEVEVEAAWKRQKSMSSRAALEPRQGEREVAQPGQHHGRR